MNNINTRLEALEARLKEPSFLRGAGLGNEVNFHVFDYDPALEPVVHTFIPRLKARLEEAGISALHLDLYGLMLEQLQSSDALEACFELEAASGSALLKQELLNMLHTEVIVESIRVARETPHDLILLGGVGAAFPVLRSHTVLNQLHSLVSEPLVLFFPGSYNGARLELFGQFEDDHYYRAFQIVPVREAS